MIWRHDVISYSGDTWPVDWPSLLASLHNAFALSFSFWIEKYDTNATCICLTLLKSYWSSLKKIELWLIPCEMSCPWISKKKIQLVQLIVCIHCHELGLLTFWFRLTHSFLDSSYPPKLKFSFVHSDLLTPSLISQTYLNWDVPFSSSSCSGTRL